MHQIQAFKNRFTPFLESSLVVDAMCISSVVGKASRGDAIVVLALLFVGGFAAGVFCVRLEWTRHVCDGRVHAFSKRLINGYRLVCCMLLLAFLPGVRRSFSVFGGFELFPTFFASFPPGVVRQDRAR